MNPTTYHKNWPVICQIRDPLFQMAVALLDLTTQFGQEIARSLPSYFTDEQVNGPYPLSMLMEISYQWGLENEPDEPLYFHRYDLEHTGTFERFSIPTFWYDKTPNEITGGGHTEKLTHEMRRKVRAAGGWGGVITHEGKRLFVASVLYESGYTSQNLQTMESVLFAPAELISVEDIDLKRVRQQWQQERRRWEKRNRE